MDRNSVDRAAAREILGLVLRNARSSVIGLVAVLLVIVIMGLMHGRPWAAAALAVTGVITAAWRWWLARRFADPRNLSDAECDEVRNQLEANAVLSGLNWTVGTLGIYPALPGTLATTYAVMMCGALTVGAFFLAVVGRAFVILAVLQLAALLAVSLFGPANVQSFALAVVIPVFGYVTYRAAEEFRKLATESIVHGLQADEANENLKHALADAEKATLAKSQFLATMSHEIRTPMNGVLGALDLLRRSKLDTQQRRLVRTAAASGESLMSILNDVLDHSKVEAGKLALSLGPLSLRSVAEAVVGLYRANAEAKGLSLELEAAPDSPDAVVGDAQRLKQVLLNLVGNAIKFTERGAVRVRLLAAPAAPGLRGVRVEVKDSGIGVPKEELEHLFEPFYQVDASTHRKHGGTGLGLAISQRIVQAMGGQIQVDSEADGGARFFFELQLAASDATTVQVESGFTNLEDPSALSGTVLVVEDNEVNRMIAVEMLQSMGLHTIEAGNGAEALEQIFEKPIDVVLMDVQMPVMDGYAATAQIREREAKLGLGRLPIVALTANAFDEDAAYALAVGMDAHLAKPYTLQQLRGTLAACL